MRSVLAFIIAGYLVTGCASTSQTSQESLPRFAPVAPVPPPHAEVSYAAVRLVSARVERHGLDWTITASTNDAEVVTSYTTRVLPASFGFFGHVVAVDGSGIVTLRRAAEDF